MKHALSAVLFTVGVKLLARSWLEEQLGERFNLYLLVTVIALLATGVVVSIWDQKSRREIGAQPAQTPGETGV